MEEVHGSVITSDDPGRARHAGRAARASAEELVDALVEVHAVDWRACGLEGYGKPTGYLERQLRRFNGLWEHNKTRELPLVQEVGDVARATTCRSRRRPTIVHGDYRLGNTMVADDAPARAGRDLRLGAVDDRRPARRPRLPDRHLGRAGRPGGHDVREPVARSPGARASSRREELIARYEERQRPLDVRAQLVPGARAVEGGRVHGGQLQALRSRQHRRRVPGAVRRGRARCSPRRRREIAAAAMKGLLVDFGGVLTTNVLDSFRAFCEAEGLDPRGGQAAVPRGPAGARAAARARARRADRGGVRRALRRAARAASERHAGLVDRLFGRHAAGRGDARGAAPGARAGREDRADLELDGRRAATTARPSPSCSTAS